MVRIARRTLADADPRAICARLTAAGNRDDRRSLTHLFLVRWKTSSEDVRPESGRRRLSPQRLLFVASASPTPPWPEWPPIPGASRSLATRARVPYRASVPRDDPRPRQRAQRVTRRRPRASPISGCAWVHLAAPLQRLRRRRRPRVVRGRESTSFDQPRHRRRRRLRSFRHRRRRRRCRATPRRRASPAPPSPAPPPPPRGPPPPQLEPRRRPSRARHARAISHAAIPSPSAPSAPARCRARRRPAPRLGSGSSSSRTARLSRATTGAPLQPGMVRAEYRTVTPARSRGGFVTKPRRHSVGACSPRPRGRVAILLPAPTKISSPATISSVSTEASSGRNASGHPSGLPTRATRA